MTHARAWPPGVKLTDRQRQVLDLVTQGKTNFEIAEDLGISLDGAKWHLRELFTGLNVNSREEAAAWWREQRSVRGRMIRMASRLAFAPGLRWLVAGVAVGVATGLGVALFLLNSPDQSMAPSPSPTADNVIDGRTCDSGRLVNGFLVLEGGEPRPSCIVTVTATAPQRMYELNLPPDSGFNQVGSAGGDSTGHIEYDVQTANGAARPAISLTVSRQYDRPLAVAGGGQAVTASDLFPGPGVILKPEHSSAVGALWVEPSGLYQLDVDTALTSLTIEQVAGMLTYYDAANGGNGMTWDPETHTAEAGRIPWAYPAGTTTGHSSLDAVIAAVTSGDADGFTALAHTTDVPCQEATTSIPGPATCPAGAAPGTKVDGYLFGCRADAVVGVSANPQYLFGSTTHGGATMWLLAAIREPADAPAPYAAVFTDGKYLSLTWVDDRGAVGVGWQCDQSILEAPPAGGSFLLPPLLPPPLALHGTPTGGP